VESALGRRSVQAWESVSELVLVPEASAEAAGRESGRVLHRAVDSLPTSSPEASAVAVVAGSESVEK
jgi:hypothetical protein